MAAAPSLSVNDLWYTWLSGVISGNVTGISVYQTVNGYTGQQVFTRSSAPNPITSQNAATTGNGTAYDAGFCVAAAGVQITSSATLTAGIIAIQASLDGTSWGTLTTITAATDFTAAMTKCYNVPGGFRYYRTAITTNLTGGNITSKVGAS